jgi:hypothetical protein
MNTERLREISDWLKAGAPERGGVSRFNMLHWLDQRSCGTICCIGGTALQWYGKGRAKTIGVASKLLDLGSGDAHELFYALKVPDSLENITPDWAARCIDKLIATGMVDWLGTREA